MIQEVLCMIQPTEAMITKWRKEAAVSGRHLSISHEAVQMLDPDVARELRGLDIEPLRVVDLR